MPLELTEFNARAFGKLLNTTREHGSGDIRGDRARGRQYLGLKETNLVLVNLGLYARTGLVVELS